MKTREKRRKIEKDLKEEMTWKGRSELLYLATNIFQYSRWLEQRWARQLVHNRRKATERCESEMSVQMERVGKVTKKEQLPGRPQC